MDTLFDQFLQEKRYLQESFSNLPVVRVSFLRRKIRSLGQREG